MIVLIIVLVSIIFFLALFQEIMTIDDLIHGKFRTKRDFLLALIPGYPFYAAIKCGWKELQ